MRDVQVNGVRLAVTEAGDGPAILAIHGCGSSVALWADALTTLARHGRAIGYDRRGCGASERPDRYEITSVAVQADDAAALLDALGASPAIVIGRSYGGDIAVDLALRYPGHVRALVLLDGVPTSIDAHAAAWEARERARVLEVGADHPGRVGQALIDVFVGDGAWDQFPPPIRQVFTANGPAIVAELRGGSLETTTDALATIAVPTLLVASQASGPTYGDVTAIAAAAIPDSRMHVVAGDHIIDPAGQEVIDFIEHLAGSDQP